MHVKFILLRMTVVIMEDCALKYVVSLLQVKKKTLEQ